MKRGIVVAAASLLAVISFGSVANADEYLGSYMARISDRDHEASDGYALSTAAQMVRQDRANWHKFGSGDDEDQGDDWFTTNGERANLQKMLERSGAMSASTRRAIENGEPVVEVEVYERSVKVRVVSR